MTTDRFALRAKTWNVNPRTVAMFKAFADLYRQEIPLALTHDLLDMGGGTGLVAFELAPSVKSVTIVDSSPAMVSVAREHIVAEQIPNCSIIEGDFLHAPLNTLSYDRIHAHMSMHHVEDTEGAFRRFFSLLRPTGLMIIGDMKSEDGSFHGDTPVPHNGFDTDALTELLTKIGFINIRELPLDRVQSPRGDDRKFDRFFLVAEKKPYGA